MLRIKRMHNKRNNAREPNPEGVGYRPGETAPVVDISWRLENYIEIAPGHWVSKDDLEKKNENSEDNIETMFSTKNILIAVGIAVVLAFIISKK